MVKSSVTVAGLQSQVKKAFDDAEKELDVGILHLERALDVGGKATLEVVDGLKETVSEIFAKIKKIVMKFNSSALFFIGLNVGPLKPRLHVFFTADCNDLSLISRRIRKNRKKERSAVSQRESQKVKPPKPRANTVKRQKLFAPDEPRKGRGPQCGMQTSGARCQYGRRRSQKNPKRKLLVSTQLLEAETILF